MRAQAVIPAACRIRSAAASRAIRPISVRPSPTVTPRLNPLAIFVLFKPLTETEIAHIVELMLSDMPAWLAQRT